MTATTATKNNNKNNERTIICFVGQTDFPVFVWAYTLLYRSINHQLLNQERDLFKQAICTIHITFDA